MSPHAVRTSIRAVWVLIAVSQFVPAWAQPPGNKPDSPAGAVASAPDSPAALRSELDQLKTNLEAESRRFDERSKELDSERAALKWQLQQLAALEAKLGVADSPLVAAAAPQPAKGQVLVAAPPQSVPQSLPEVQTPQDLSDRIGNLEQRIKTFGPFTFSGDIRLREEPFFGGPSSGSLDQNRERFRLRFNVDARLNDDFSGGFSLASGDINDPTTTNQTVTGFYTRTPIAIDKAFVLYSPHQFHALTLEAGKFAYPWYNTELTWDKDLNPEGAAEALAFDVPTPVLKKLAFVAFELPFSQVAGVAIDASLHENVVYGGQVQTQWQLAHWLKFGAFSGFYDYTNADPIAFALATANSKAPQTPLTGLLPLGTGNTVQNSILTTTDTSVVTVGGAAYPTGVAKVTNAQFESKFGLFDSLATFDVSTPWQRWPIKLIGDYVQNTEACANLANLKAVPVDTVSLQYSQSTNFACNAHQRRGYWAEFQLGQANKRGDWEFDYTRIFIEREAVLSNFDYSDIRQGSNVTEHRAMVIYQVHRNVQLSYTALIGRPLNFASKSPPQNWLERMQFDVIYTF
jgi:Putative porin